MGRILVILFTTGQCNLRCSYCGGSFPREVVPWGIGYGLDELEKFLGRLGEYDIAFYGGEPLLNPGFIRAVMDRFGEARFVIQTNGTLIHMLEPDYWRRFTTVLLSIDGREEVTDYYRGRGVYRLVARAARRLREYGFQGDLVARMAVSSRSDIYLDVTHLLELGLFDHVHWQLDAVWSDWKNSFWRWAEEVYMPGISRLVDYWIDAMRRGRVLGIAPFLGVLRVDLLGEPNYAPPCGAGVNSVAVSTDGRVLLCPIAVREGWAYMGDLREPDLRLPGRPLIADPCTGCRYFRYCGGRCLYAYLERYWGEDGFKMLCRVTAHLVEEVRRALPEARRLLESGTVDPSVFDYPPFNNTVEIIP